jgi:hypothetical protein
MKRNLPLVLATIFLIVAGTVEARHSSNASKASGGRAATSAAPAGNAKGAGSHDHGGTAQSHAPGTPTPASGAKNFGAKVPPSVMAQGRASSNTQLAMLHGGTRADAGELVVAPSQMPTAHAPQTLVAAVSLIPTGQPMSPAPNSCNQPAPGPKNFGAKVPPSVMAQGRASASSMQLALQKGTSADAGGIAVAPSQMPTAHAPQTLRAAVPPCPTGQATSPSMLNSCAQPAPSQHLIHRSFFLACGPWCYNRGLGYGMIPYEAKEDCEKLKDIPEAYQECLARKTRYSPALPADGGRD